MNDSNGDWEKIKFVIAIMTRDFVRGIEIGRSILVNEPSNTNVREYLTIIEKIDIDSETNPCTDTDNKGTCFIRVCDKNEKNSNANALIQNRLKISASSKIDSLSVKNDYSSLGNLNKIDGKMHRILPIKFCKKID